MTTADEIAALLTEHTELRLAGGYHDPQSRRLMEKLGELLDALERQARATQDVALIRERIRWQREALNQSGGSTMGLDTTHNCWHGAYSAFGRWRVFLAELVGFEVTRERYVWRGNDVGFERHKPLAYLLGHSDRDGSIPLGVQIPLAEYLERLIAEYPDGNLGGHVQEWHAKTKQFADGLRLAHSLGEEVEFR